MPTQWDEFEAVEEPKQETDWNEFEPAPVSQIKLSPYQQAEFASMQAGRGKPETGMEPGTEFTKSLFVQLPRDIGKGLHTVGGAIGDIAKAYAFEAIGEPELQAQQLGATKEQLTKLGASPVGLAEPGEKPWEQGAEMLPTVPRVAAKTAAGFIETAPQLALSAVNPALGAISFGFTPEGFDPITAGAMLALPGVGKYTGRIAELAAERLGVPIGTATGLAEKIGGASGIAGLISADQYRHIASLPEQERQRAFEDAAGTALAIFAMSMAHRPPSERQIFLGEPKEMPSAQEAALRLQRPEMATVQVPGLQAPSGIVRLPSGIPIEAPSVTKETARQAAIRQFNERLSEMKFKTPRATVPEGPEPGMELATQPTPEMHEIKEPASYDEFVSDLTGKITPDMTVKQVQEMYPKAFKRGENLINKEAAGELLSDAKKLAHPIDWLEQEMESGKKVGTGNAYEVGLRVRTVEDLERLAQLREKLAKKSAEAIAAKNINRAVAIGTSMQLPVEAIEAATFIGGKRHPGLPENRPLDVRSFPEVREWLRKNANRFGEGYANVWLEQLGEKPAAEAAPAEAPKPEVKTEAPAPAAQPAPGGFIGLSREKWTLPYLEGLGATRRAPVIRQAIAALKDVGGKTKLAENATPQTLLKAVNEIMDLRAKKQAEVLKPSAEKTVPVYHGEGGAEGAGLGGFSVSESQKYAASFGPKQSVVEVPESVLAQMKEDARNRGEPSNLVLPEEYQKQLRPVDKVIEPEVFDTDIISKSPVQIPPSIPEPAKPETPTVQAPPTVSAEKPTPPPIPSKPLPKAGEELFKVEGAMPEIDRQRRDIVSILNEIEIEDSQGRLKPKKLGEDQLEELRGNVSKLLGLSPEDVEVWDAGDAAAALRERLNEIEKAKLSGKPLETKPPVSETTLPVVETTPPVPETKPAPVETKGDFARSFKVGDFIIDSRGQVNEVIKQKKTSTLLRRVSDGLEAEMSWSADSKIWNKTEAPAEPKWKGMTIDEIRKKLPVGFDGSTARIEGDRVIARQKPEYGGKEMYVDIKKGEAEPVTPEPVTPEVAEKPKQPETPIRNREFGYLKSKRDLWQSALARMEERLAENEANQEKEQYGINDPRWKDLYAERQRLKQGISKLTTAINTIGGDMGLARMREEAEAAKGKPVATGTQNITNKVLKAQKDDLMEKVDDAIKAAPEEGTEKITISVEGDGEFTLNNTKDTLKKFKSLAESQFPSAVGGPKEPGLPSAEGKAIPEAKDPKPKDEKSTFSKVAGQFVSEDKSRESILTAYSDGTQIVATDGRQMIRIVTDKAPGSPDAPVRINKKGEVVKAEGKFPNWKIIADPKAELILGGMDTAELAHIAHQAKVFRDTTVDKDRRAQHGVEIYVNKDRTLGARMRIVDELYEHNIQEGAIFAGTYNPDYLATAMNAARRLGNEMVDAYAHSGETGPLGFIGKNFDYIVMPMRIEKGIDRADATKFLPVSGKAVHGKLPEGLGPIENPTDPIVESSQLAGSGNFRTTVSGDTIKFEEIKERSESSRSRGEPSTYEETVAEIELSKFPEGEKSQRTMIQEAIEPYTGKTSVKGIANALLRDTQKALARRREIERNIQERKQQAEGIMPPGPGAASPAEFVEREIKAGNPPPEPPKETNPGVPIDGSEPPTPEIVRKANDFNILNRFNSGQWSFYFGKLGEAAKAAWERMAIGEFRMRESIQRDVQNLVDVPLKTFPKELRKEGGKAFFDVLNGRKMESIEAEWANRPGGNIVIEQARKVKTRLEEIRTTIRDIKRESYRSYLMGMKKEMLEQLYERNIFEDTQGKPKEALADALTLDQFPDDWGIADGSYLPHLFFGQWKVSASLPGGEQPLFITRAKTPAEAKARIYELTQNNPEYRDAQFTIEQDMVMPADMIRLGDGSFWRLIAQMKEQAQGNLDPKEAVQGIIGRKASKQKWFGSLQKRQGFEGYSKDYKQVMTAYLNGFQRWKELTAMNREVQPLIEQVKREGRLNAAGRLTDIMDTLWGKPSQMTLDFDAFLRDIPVIRDIVKPLALDRWARFINSTVTNLTLRTIRFGVVNRLQPLQGLYPLIGERLMMEAKILQHSPEGRRLLDEAGVNFDPGQYAGEYTGGGKFKRFIERLSGEKPNQEYAFLGMYLHGRERGLSHSQAIQYGKIRGQLMTQFTPLIVDVPPIMEGPLGRVTFQFKRFPVKQIELLARMAADRNLPALTRYFAVMAASGGLALMLKQVYADKEKRLRVKRVLNKSLGEKGSDYVFYGLPGLIGADLSGSLVLGDEPYGENLYEKLGRTVLGPAPSMTYEIGKSVAGTAREPISATDKTLAISRKIPSLRQIVELTDLIRGNLDVTTPDGEIKYRRKLRDVILGLGSFRSANEANIQTAVSAIIELKKEVQTLKNDLWLASRSRDQEKVSAARQAIKDYNHRWPEAAITPEEIERYFSSRKGYQPKTDVERAVGNKYRALMPAQ